MVMSKLLTDVNKWLFLLMVMSRLAEQVTVVYDDNVQLFFMMIMSKLLTECEYMAVL